jgi:CO/xanthine dehydrogenase Mo-binding subunit
VAEATVDERGVHVVVRAGQVLDDVVLRSYCIGAAHMALGWVCSEGIAVDDAGEPQDLTIRSFGVLRPAEMPPVTLTIVDDPAPARARATDAVFASVAAAAWNALGRPTTFPAPRR